jgi:hypothetical protein
VHWWFCRLIRQTRRSDVIDGRTQSHRVARIDLGLHWLCYELTSPLGPPAFIYKVGSQSPVRVGWQVQRRAYANVGYLMGLNLLLTSGSWASGASISSTSLWDSWAPSWIHTMDANHVDPISYPHVSLKLLLVESHQGLHSMPKCT